MKTCRSVFFLLVVSLVATEDQFIKIVLTPRDYIEPCDEEGFICGVDKNVDSERLIAEQNSDVIFQFLDKTSDIGPNYTTSVFAVSIPNAAGQLVKLSDGTENDPGPGLLSLFLTPSKSRCNKLTFEDAKEEKRGYYPIFIGYNTNWTLQISKFESDAEQFRKYFNGKTPNLCGTLTRMEEESGQSRVDTLTQLFNFMYNSGRNDLSPAADCCATRIDMKEAILQSGFFDTTQSISLETTSISTFETDGFIKVDLYRNTTGTKQIVFIDTEFSTGNSSLSAADINDIVPYNFPVVFKKGAKATSVIVRIKADLDDEEDDEYFIIKMSSVMKRRKRDLSAYEVLVTIRKQWMEDGNYLHTHSMGNSHIQGLCRLWLSYHYLIVNLAMATGQESKANKQKEYLTQDPEPDCEDNKWVKEEAVRFYTETGSGPSPTANSDGMKHMVKEDKFKSFFILMKNKDKMGQLDNWEDFKEITIILIDDSKIEALLTYITTKSAWILNLQNAYDKKDAIDTRMKSLLTKLLLYTEKRIYGYIRSAALQIWLLNNKGRRHDDSGDLLYRSKEFGEDAFTQFGKEIGDAKIDDIIQMNDFTSTSTIPRARDDDRNIFWTFQACQNHGASVKDFSAFQEEDEVLLPAGECYALVSYKKEKVSYQVAGRVTKKIIQEVVYSCIECPSP